MPSKLRRGSRNRAVSSVSYDEKGGDSISEDDDGEDEEIESNDDCALNEESEEEVDSDEESGEEDNENEESEEEDNNDEESEDEDNNNEEEDNNDEESEEEDTDVDEHRRAKRRSSTTSKKNTTSKKISRQSNTGRGKKGRNGKLCDGGDTDGEDKNQPERRKSSRSTKYSGKLKEPRDSIADLLKPMDDIDSSSGAKRKLSVSGGKKNNITKTITKVGRKRNDEANGTVAQSPKSPAVRHKSRRRHPTPQLHGKLQTVTSDEDETSEDDSDDDEDDSEDEGDEDEEEELKVQKIVASRNETKKVWDKICSKMNTSEINMGSRWFQTDSDDDKRSSIGDDNTFQERFLVKWADLSHLHCSWETEHDLLDQVDNAKSYLSTFFRKAVNGRLYTSDERGDGEYHDPCFIQIDRILEVIDPEDEEQAVIALDPTMIEEFENGTGRQFLIKWTHVAYSDSTYEFERDLILNEIDFEEHLAHFVKRSKKPNRAIMTKASLDGDKEMRRLYTIFGENISIRSAKTERDIQRKVKAYQDKLEKKVFANGGRLRDYQAEGVSFMMGSYINQRSSILADEMGLGKTIQTAVFISTVASALHCRGPFLIVAPLSTIPHWQREFSGWTNLNTIVYHGSGQDREYMREFEFPFEKDRPTSIPFNSLMLGSCFKKSSSKYDKTWMAQVVITTPEMLVADDFAELAAVKWTIMVVDEAHRLKNHSSKLGVNIRKKFNFSHSLLLTGTPIQNNMSELWTLLNFIAEDEFDDLDTFLEKYGDMKTKEAVDDLHEKIRPYILRRLKEDVEKSVPPKEETLIEVELTVSQKQYYRALYEKNVQFLHRNHKRALDGPSMNNLAMQLRKCCNHPFLLRGVEQELRKQQAELTATISEADFLVKNSGKLVLLDKLLPKLKLDGHRILIFSQFKIMLDILEDYLLSRKMKFERIDGCITGLKRQSAIDRFQAKSEDGKESSFVMLLSTKAGGVGINLTAADTVVIFDSDWNPQNDLQAQARCHRIGQTKSVKVYRLISRKTYEMQMFHHSSLKMGLDQAVLNGIENKGADGNNGEGILSRAEIEKLLRHGAYDIFNEDKTGKSEQESNEFMAEDIDSILTRRATTVVHDNTGSNSSAKGGTFSKASFKASSSLTGAALEGSAEDVDIDDPEFWKKMVGEAKVEDDTTLLNKKRKRNRANYSERDYDRNIKAALEMNNHTSPVKGADKEMDSSAAPTSESDDESSESDSGGKNAGGKKPRVRKKKAKERIRWGGTRGDEFDRKDFEALVHAMVAFGYNKLGYDDIAKEAKFERVYDLNEVKRVSWAAVLLMLRETADEDAIAEVLLQEKKLKIKEKKMSSSNDGGVLATASNDGGGIQKEPSGKIQLTTEQLEKSFQSLWHLHKYWAIEVVNDASRYAATTTRRSKDSIMKFLYGKEETEKPQSPTEAAFAENVWSALKSRGWTEDSAKNGKASPSKRFLYQKKTYKSISSVLEAIPMLHPELGNVVKSIRTSIAKNSPVDSGISPLNLDPNNLSAAGLTEFLEAYAPLQLLLDRKKGRRVPLPKRYLLTISYLATARRLVEKADSSGNKVKCIAGLIPAHKKSGLPHPRWKEQQDVMLVCAVAKHGWLDKDNRYNALIADKTIDWGEPFNGVPSVEESNNEAEVVKGEKPQPAGNGSLKNNETQLISDGVGVAVHEKQLESMKIIEVTKIREDAVEDVCETKKIQETSSGVEATLKENIEKPTANDSLNRGEIVALDDTETKNTLEISEEMKLSVSENEHQLATNNNAIKTREGVTTNVPKTKETPQLLDGVDAIVGKCHQQPHEANNDSTKIGEKVAIVASEIKETQPASEDSVSKVTGEQDQLGASDDSLKIGENVTTSVSETNASQQASSVGMAATVEEKKLQPVTSDDSVKDGVVKKSASESKENQHVSIGEASNDSKQIGKDVVADVCKTKVDKQVSNGDAKMESNTRTLESLSTESMPISNTSIEAAHACPTVSKSQEQEHSKPEDKTSQDPKPEDEKSQDNALYNSISRSAVASSEFLNKKGELLGNMKHFNCNKLIVDYCLKQNIDCTWFVEYEMLKASDIRRNKPETVSTVIIPLKFYALPGRLELLKRARVILGKNSTSIEIAANFLGDMTGGYIAIDQNNRANFLLLEMLRALIKLKLSKAPFVDIWHQLMSCSKAEAGRLACYDVALKVIFNQINIVERYFRPNSARSVKNVLRVMLGIEPILPRNPTDGVFPSSLFRPAPKLDLTNTTRVSSSKNMPCKKQQNQSKPSSEKVKQKENALGDVAINRALVTGVHKSNDSSLLLTSMETLLLSVICSQGLPVWSEDWEVLLSNAPIKSNSRGAPTTEGDFRINWIAMGNVIEAAARAWYRTASQKLENSMTEMRRVSKINAGPSNNSIMALCTEACKKNQIDVDVKKRTLEEAEELTKHPENLARKTIMMLEALRCRMGRVDTSGGDWKKVRTMNKSEHNLGPKVLQWCGKELVRWAKSLNILGPNGAPLSATAAEYMKHDPNLRVVADLDKKTCRTIFSQVSQQTRLRSIFILHGTVGMRSLIEKALRASKKNEDLWTDQPSWWQYAGGIGHDFDLLQGVLVFGYSGFEVMCNQNNSFRSRMEEDKRLEAAVRKNHASPSFTRGSIQIRVNQLTRELNVIEDNANAFRIMQNIHSSTATDIEKRKRPLGSIQTGIGSFFATNQAAKAKPDNSAAVVDVDSSDDACANVTSLKHNIATECTSEDHQTLPQCDNSANDERETPTKKSKISTNSPSTLDSFFKKKLV